MSETPYLTAAASIGMTQDDIALFIKRLDKVLAEKNKKSSKAITQETGRKTPTAPQVVDMSLGRRTPTNVYNQSIENQGRKTPIHDGLGRKTPTPQEKKTPTHVYHQSSLPDSQGNKRTPTHISSSVECQGRKTPTAQILESYGRKTPTQQQHVSNNNHEVKANKKLTQGTSQLTSTDV